MNDFVPEGWQKKTLEDCYSRFSSGMTPSRARPEYFKGKVPWVSSGELNYNRILNTKEKITDEAVKNTNLKLYPKDTFFIAITGLEAAGTRGRCAILGVEATVNQSCMAFEPIDEVDTKFLFQYYMLHGEQFAFTYAQGTKQQSFNASIVKILPLLLPPLPEQQKIASILTSVDEVIENTQAQINKLKDLKTGMMQELLTRGVGVDGNPHTEFKDSPVGRIPEGWEVDTFDNVFTLKNGVNKGKEFFGQGVPIISYRNVYDGNGIYDYMLTNRVEMTESELSRFKVEIGDIFITRTSETLDEIGFANVYLGNLGDVVYNGFVIRARQKRKIFDLNYCKYAFQARYMRQQMINSSKYTTRAGISGESLNLLKVVIPPLSEQQIIGETLSAVDVRIQALMKVRTSKSSLKKALMQDLLTGKIRVKVED